MKKYTDEQLLKMSEDKVLRLFETGKMDDDDCQRWYDLKEEAQWEAKWFIEHELKYYQ